VVFVVELPEVRVGIDLLSGLSILALGSVVMTTLSAFVLLEVPSVAFAPLPVVVGPVTILAFAAVAPVTAVTSVLVALVLYRVRT
jgi:hypothetical protein